MDWYYAENGEQKGPVTEETFQVLLANGTVTDETLVWQQGMAQWTPWGELQAAQAAPATEDVSATSVELVDSTSETALESSDGTRCSLCGRFYPPEEMLQFEDRWICASCKPVYFQTLQEDAALPHHFHYAGFWIRFLAKAIDGILLGIVGLLTNMLTSLLILGDIQIYATDYEDAGAFFLLTGVNSLVGLLIGLTYTTFFLGKFGATPGKMACGLRVIRADGSRITYWRAFGRHFAEMVSQIIMYIGYLMAAFDEEKRALHDRICDTRVVHKK